MNINFDISGWREDRDYEKHDVVFFTGDYKNSTTGCLSIQSGYYYAELTQAGAAGSYNATVASQSPTGSSTKWTRSFPSTPSYGSSVSFEAFNDRIDFGDGYYNLIPKAHNSLHTKYNLNFAGRTDKETKAILHFLDHRYETPYSGAQRTDDGVQVLTGFNFTPFAPYDQSGIYHCENFTHEHAFLNVNNIQAEFIRDTDTPTNWKNKTINLDNTSGFWQAGVTYSKFDIVYYSGHNVSNLSGYYYYSGESPTTSSSSNKPSVGSTLWSKNDFFFKPTQVSNSQKLRILKQDFANTYAQRASDGLNSNLLKLDLTFDGRDNKESKALVHFLLEKQGYQNFSFTPPKPYQQENKFFTCQKWTESIVFDENKSVTASFEEHPIDFTPPKTTFKTLLFNSGDPSFGRDARVIGNAAEGFNPPDGREVYLADFGTFMTGFQSGSGFYLLNSGNQRIISNLHLSGNNGTTGLYKFIDQPRNKSFDILNGSATHAQYTLDPLESGFFEVQFALTGKSSLIGENSTLGLEDGITFYERGHGGAGYPGPFNKGSQLYVNTTDRFGTSDTSGTLKVDLTGNASPVGPGPLTDFRANISSGVVCPVITGSFEFTEPFTATGVYIEVSGLPNTQSHATSPATGVLEDYNSFSGIFGYHRNYYLDPLKNFRAHLTHENLVEDKYVVAESNETIGGFFDFYCKPGKTYYFRAKAQNIDIIGGNLNGGTSRTVLSSDYIHTSVTVPQMDLQVPTNQSWVNKVKSEYGEGVKSIGPSETFGKTMLENLNLHGMISGTLSGAKNVKNIDNRLGDNADLDIDDFAAINCNINDDTVVFSADHTVPALITGPKVTFADGSAVRLKVSIPKSSAILGAGGKGADSFQKRSAGDSTGYPAASFTIAPGQPGMDRSNCKVGSVIELQGTGPISLYATSGLLDGRYMFPLGGDSHASNVKPQNAQDGGTAFHIDTSYNNEILEIHNLGFIGGGGGGGGAGGIRISNQVGLQIWSDVVNIPNFGTSRDILADGTKVYSKLNRFFADNNPSTKTPGWRQGADTLVNPHMLQNRGLKNADDKPIDGKHTNIREIRPGGGGGAGCGYDVQENITMAVNHDELLRSDSIASSSALKTDMYGNIVGISTATAVGVGTADISYTKNSTISLTKGGVGTKSRSLPKSAKQHAGSPVLYKIDGSSQAGQPCYIDLESPWLSYGGLGGAGSVGNRELTEDLIARGAVGIGDPSGMNVHHPTLDESFYNGGGFGGEGGYWGQDGSNGEHPVQGYIDRFISERYGPEPRNFSFAGTGGLCIETNGANVKFTPTGGIPTIGLGAVFNEGISSLPCSGQDDKDKSDPKSSELYRNVYGVGGYLTCKHTNFTTKASNDPLPIGLISGLQGRRLKASDTANYGIRLSDKGGAYVVDAFASDLVRASVIDKTIEGGDYDDNLNRLKNIAGPSFEDVDRKVKNSSNAISQNASGSGMLPWKAFNQKIDGNFDDYVFFDSGVGGVVGFPYYLIYDLGEGNEATVGSFSLTNAGASLSYYQNGDNHLNLFGACYAPTEFELRATNLPPSTAGEAETVGDTTVASHMLDKNTTLLWSHVSANKSAKPSDEVINIKPGGYYGRISPPKDALGPGKLMAPDIVYQGRNLKMYSQRKYSYPRLAIINDVLGEGSVILYDGDGNGLNKVSFRGAVKNFNGTEFNHYVSVPGAIRRYTIRPNYKSEDHVYERDAKGVANSVKFTVTTDNEIRKKYRYYILKIYSADHFPMEAFEYNAGVTEKGVYPTATKGGKCKIADFGLRGLNYGYAGFISDRS